MAIFSGIIICSQCNKKVNFKNNNGTHEYVCQIRKNKGVSKCDSQILKEKDLLELIEHHCKIHSKDYSPSKVKLFVHQIILNKNEFIIYFIDGSKIESLTNSISFE